MCVMWSIHERRDDTLSALEDAGPLLDHTLLSPHRRGWGTQETTATGPDRLLWS